MQMISRRPLRHNELPRLVQAGLFLLGILALCGLYACNGSDQGDSPSASGATLPAVGPVSVDTGAWRAFVQTGTSLMAGENPDPAELQAFALTPAAGAWRRSMAPTVPSLVRMTNWLIATFGDKPGKPLPYKNTPDLRAMTMSFRYSFNHRALVDSLVAGLGDPDVLGKFQAKLATWIEPDSLPRHLVLACLPAKPEIRIQQDTVLIDTGVLTAGGIPQTMDQTASLLYRTYQVPPVTNPAGLKGEDSLAESCLLMRNEGVAAYIEKRVDTYFRQDHPKLNKVSIIPQGIAFIAGSMIAKADTILPPLMTDPDLMAARASDFANSMVASGGFTKLGYAMAATIAGNLGEDRLAASSRTVRGFFAAYQEAAALNPLPRPQPGAAGYSWYASVRPFDHDLYLDLKDILERRHM